MWQSEFTLNVACWYAKIRIRPPQTSPASPAVDRAADPVAEEERQAEREDHPEEIEPVDPADELVVVEILPVLAALLHAEVREEPADVRVDEAADGTERSVRVSGVRRVRVAGLVRERVVLAVVGDPLRERPLHRHAAEDRERRLDRPARLEAAVREVAVEPDRRPEGADDVEAGEEREVEPVERDAPEEAHRGEDPERRDDHRDERDDLADPARPRADRSDSRGGIRHRYQRY